MHSLYIYQRSHPEHHTPHFQYVILKFNRYYMHFKEGFCEDIRFLFLILVVFGKRFRRLCKWAKEFITLPISKFYQFASSSLRLKTYWRLTIFLFITNLLYFGWSRIHISVQHTIGNRKICSSQHNLHKKLCVRINFLSPSLSLSYTLN